MSGRTKRIAAKLAAKLTRKEKNYDRNMAIYARGTSSLPAEYLTVHQASDPAVVEKIKAAAQARRDRRSGKVAQ